MKIKVEEKELQVTGLYCYRYTDGKLVLRFSVTENDADFSALQKMLNNAEKIEYYEQDDDEKPKCVYCGYTEFSASYAQGVYSVEQITPSTLNTAVQEATHRIQTAETLIEEMQEIIVQQTRLLQEQETVIDSQAQQIGMLTECALEVSQVLYSVPEAQMEGGENNE